MNWGNIGVSTRPGHKAFTRMLSGAKVWARDLVRPTTANLAAEYTGISIEPTSPAIEAVNTIAPPPRFLMYGTTSLALRTDVRTLRSMVLWYASTSMFSMPAGPGHPA